MSDAVPFTQLGQKLKSVSMITTGKMESNMKLELESLIVSGEINGNQGETAASPKGVYNLLEYIDSLELKETEVPPGKPPRGQTKFVLVYQDGRELILGMNLNEEGLKYLELDPAEFMQLRERWMSM